MLRRKHDKIFGIREKRTIGDISIGNKFGGFLGEVQEIDVDNNERMLSLVKYLTRLIDSHMLQSSKSAP